MLVALALLLAGAGAATWGLAHYRPAARFLGVDQAPAPAAPAPLVSPSPPAPPETPAPGVQAEDEKIAALEARLSRVESATRQAEGSAGRADALVVAFAARRAIDRGVALGYLEPLLIDRFGAQHRQAIATIVTASHQPVMLNDLISEYDSLGPQLRSGGPQDSWWTDFKREMASMIEIHRSSRPPTNPEARYNRAMQRLSSGEVDLALAETTRLPGAERAGDWTTKARRYIAAHRALDEIESAALLGGPNTTH